MKNLDAYHDGLLAKHLTDEDVQWTVVCNDDGEDGYLVIDEDGESDGGVYDSWDEAQEQADKLNTEVDDDFEESDLPVGNPHDNP
jgi:hypothetical protein